MLTIGVNGASGRMGSRILALAREDKEFAIAAALERKDHPSLGKDAGEVAGIGPLGVKLAVPLPPGVKVLIDFSAPPTTQEQIDRIRECVKNGTSMVIGTTALKDDVQAEIKKAAEKVAVLATPNMSVGVNLLFKIAGQVAAALGEDFDIEIVESHHRFKKDAPSGTAIGLAQSIAAATGIDLKKDMVHGRQGITGERPRRQIGMHAIRAGDIVGEHTIMYASLGERIEIRHVAQSRDTFVRGALRAAKFLAEKKPGMYSMMDVLGLK